MPLTYKLRNKQYRLFFLGKPELLLGFFCAHFFLPATQPFRFLVIYQVNTVSP